MQWHKQIWVFVRFVVAWIYTLLVCALACVLMVFMGPTRVWLLMAAFWGRTTLWLVGVKLKIEGAENLRGPAVFIANHQSLIDVVFMPAILPPTTRFVAKRELSYIPLWGWAFGLCGALLINRSRPSEALRALREGLKLLPKGWSLVVFPEGTRTRTGKLQRFRKGAFYMAMRAKLPIVPIGMDGATQIVPPTGWLVRPGKVCLVVGKPLDTQHWQAEKLYQHVQEGHAAVAACVAQARANRLKICAAA